MQILIADDDKIILEQLKEMLQQIAGDGAEFRCCESREQALALIEGNGFQPDLMLMDIELAGSSGIELAGQIHDMLPQTQIIFISGFDDYYLDVYEVEHIYFLRKPVDRAQLEKAWDKVVEKLVSSGQIGYADSQKPADEKEFFRFTARHQEFLIPFRDIQYFEKYRRKVLIHTRRQEPDTFECYATMSDVLSQLPDYFMRCHNSYVINMNLVTGYQRGQIKIDEHHVPVSRTYDAAVREAFYQRLNLQLMR